MELRTKIALEALITTREAWVARIALYEARTAEGSIMEERYFHEVEDNLCSISNAMMKLLED